MSLAFTAPARAGTTASVGRVALLGNPNTGKTTLFNVMCGARAKVANFPGTTTAVRTGRCEVAGQRVEVMDLPGVYDLRYGSPEAHLARDVVIGVKANAPDVLLVVIDACNLTRNLVLVGELIAFGRPVIVALNMIDLARRRGLTVNAEALSRRLDVPVVPMVARHGEGLDALRSHLAATLTGTTPAARSSDVPHRGASIEALAAWAEQLVAEAVSGSRDERAVDPLTDWLDRALTHAVVGLLSFMVIMGALFYTLFTLAAVPMDLIEATFAGIGDLVRTVVPEGPIRDLVTDGIVGGVAGTVVFLPQICLLFFLISLLEDTGYLARAAFVMDRLLRRFGLPGHAFVPLLTSHACALPGIMSARLIPDRRDRLVTIMVAPFMSCSARLPVYVLLTSLLFADRPAVAAAAFAGCYMLGATAALLSALLLGGTVLKGRARPMVLELPTYKLPSFTNAVLTAKDQGIAFLRTAGTVIVAICVVMWWLSAYPKVATGPAVESLRAQSSTSGITSSRAEALIAEADVLQQRAAQAGSFAGRIGTFVQPVFQPLGFDWQLTVGVLTSFLAREVFVSTMAVLASAGGADDVDEGVVASIQTMVRDDGSPVFTPSSAGAALVFFVLAMQCLPTLAVTRRETGRLKYAALQLGYMSVLAYVVALIIGQSIRAAGLA